MYIVLILACLVQLVCLLATERIDRTSPWKLKPNRHLPVDEQMCVSISVDFDPFWTPHYFDKSTLYKFQFSCGQWKIYLGLGLFAYPNYYTVNMQCNHLNLALASCSQWRSIPRHSHYWSSWTTSWGPLDPLRALKTSPSLSSERDIVCTRMLEVIQSSFWLVLALKGSTIQCSFSSLQCMLCAIVSPLFL